MIASENKVSTDDVFDPVQLLPKMKNVQKLNMGFMDFVRFKNMRRKIFLLSMSWYAIFQYFSPYIESLLY